MRHALSLALTAVALTSALAPAVAATDPARVRISPITGKSKLSADEIGLVAETVAAALRELPQEAFAVESGEAAPAADPQSPCDGACAVEAARADGVAYLVTGETKQMKKGGTVLTLVLLATADGQVLVSSISEICADVNGLLAAARVAAATMKDRLAALAPAPAPPAAPIAPPPPVAVPVVAAPAAPPPPAPAPPLAIRSFRTFYAEVAALGSFVPIGGAKADFEYSGAGAWAGEAEYKVLSGPMFGARVAGYVAEDAFHIGAYAALQVGRLELDPDNGQAEDLDGFENADLGASRPQTLTLGAGLAAKAGRLLGKRFWLGGALDVGFHLTDVLDWADEYGGGKLYGLELFPRLCLDIIVLHKRQLTIAVPISLGAVVVPLGKGGVADELHALGDPQPRIDVTSSWTVAPALTIGIAIGA